ncbi:MAG: hypothetical protein WA961_14760 [Rhodanobacter sp.]
MQTNPASIRGATSGVQQCAKRPTNPPGKNGFAYRERYGVIVLCADAAEQERVYNRLRTAGHKLRVVTV